jgi:hypothetical protein
MGSNMQRQAVPLLTTEEALVCTGMELTVASNTNLVVRAEKPGKDTYVDSQLILVDDEQEYRLTKYRGLNERTCQTQKPVVVEGEQVVAGQLLADGAATKDGLAPTQMLATGADLAIGTRRPQAPYGSRDLPALPMWAYVRRDDPWRERSRVSVEELLGRTVVGVPTSFTAREALEAAVSTIGGSFTEFIEAANGTIAQALAAAGRGVAVVSDDPRYELVPIAIGLHDATLTIQLVAAWEIRKVSAPAMAALAGRLADWVAERAPRDDGEDDPGVTCTWKAPNTTE